MKPFWRILTIIFFLELALAPTSTFIISSQKIDRFTNKEGFNQNTIHAIEQDKYGFLWFGTPNGLIKYDGYEFESYSSESNANSISNNYINYLFNDLNDVLWIGTNTSLNVYIPWLEKFHNITINNNTRIRHIASDSKERIWVATQNKLYVCSAIDIENGVYEVSKNVLEPYSDIADINDYYFLDDNSILLGTKEGLLRFSIIEDSENGTLELKKHTGFSALTGTNITVIKKIKDIFWIGTDSGLFKAILEGDRMHIISSYEHLSIQDNSNSILVINDILEDHAGIIWLGTKEHGLAKYNQNTDSFENFTYDPKNKLGLSSPYINSLLEDNFNVLWIGTAQGGINKLDPSQKQFINFTHNPYDPYSISDNLINSILEDSKGRLWVSSYNESVFRSLNFVNDSQVQKLRFEAIQDFPLSKQDIVRCIYEDEKGYIWFGSDFSVVVYNPLTGRFKRIQLQQNGVPLPDQVYFTIQQTEKDKIILAGNQITVLHNPWEQVDKEEKPQIEIRSHIEIGTRIAHTILKDSRGKYWFGTDNGLLIGTVTNGTIDIINSYNANNISELSLSNSNIFSLYEDMKGNIWVGTFGGGLNKFSFDQSGALSSIDYFRKSSVLPDDAVYGILPEGEDFIWMSTDMGLCRYNLLTGVIDIFDVRDGLINNNFRQSAYFKGKSGYYYFGGLNGLTIFKPSTIKLNELPPKATITKLSVNNKLIGIGEEYKGNIILEKSISESESISINEKEQIISFDVLVNHSTSPYKNKIFYKLEGFNDDWVERDEGKTTVTYTNLSPGNYIFKVKGTNGDGHGSTNSTNLKLEITPVWYNTWWSILIFMTLIFFAAFGIIIYFVEHEKLKQRLKYEKLDKERLDISNQGKFKFFTNISHEFRTPLTLIAGPLERIIEQNTDAKNTKYLDIIQKNTKRLLSLVDQLITFRQAEQGFTNLNLSKNTLGNFLYPTTEAFENYAKEKNINFFYKFNSSNEEVIIDVEKIERIIFNLLSNSFKNTPPHGNIFIEADTFYKDDNQMIRIDVVDSGKGIPAEDLPNIFDRFYQLGDDTGKNISGGGIGLAFCNSIVNLLGGTITVKSEPFKETRFSVIIPSKTEEEFELLDNTNSGKSFIKDWVPLPTADITDSMNAKTNGIQKEYTILIVENEKDVQHFLLTSLSDKYNIVIANNGVEGLEKIKLHKPDLIISDVMMPEMDGFELCKRIKSDIEICHLPVLLLTALGDYEDLIKGLEFGADEYISKPFSIKHLELRIHKLIQNNIRLKEYFSKNSLLPKKDIEISTRDVEFLNKVIDAIEKNISDSNFGVEELAVEIGLSTSHFYRRLKQLTGQVPNVYLRNYRLQRAAELLRRNDGAKVAEVMYQIGIESSSYFSTSFKKLHGVSPSDF
tara:strand:+ start:4341 stop:8486 length:4146 start_codon:yes stop_codon:yes gene_type:complete